MTRHRSAVVLGCLVGLLAATGVAEANGFAWVSLAFLLVPALALQLVVQVIAVSMEARRYRAHGGADPRTARRVAVRSNLVCYGAGCVALALLSWPMAGMWAGSFWGHFPGGRWGELALWGVGTALLKVGVALIAGRGLPQPRGIRLTAVVGAVATQAVAVALIVAAMVGAVAWL